MVLITNIAAMCENKRNLFVAGIFIGAAYCALALCHDVVLSPDSPSYISFAPMRTAGYPLYLNAIGVKLAVKLQVFLYMLTIFLLLREIYEVCDYIIFPSLFLLLCIINPKVNQYHYMVLTESLFMTLSIMMMVFMLQFLRFPSLSSAALASLFVGLAAIVRPSAYALIPALLLMVIFRWRAIPGQRIVLMTAALLPAILICTLERIGTQTYQGAAATSVIGRLLYAKAGMIDARPASPSQDPRKLALENALQYDFAPIRKILNAVPRWDVREWISEEYEECLEYRCSQDLRNSLNLPEPAIESLAMEVGLARIASAPQAFVLLVMERYRFLWTMYQNSHPDSAPVLKAFIDEHRPLPFQDRIPWFDQIPQPSRLALFVRPVIIAIGGLTLMLGVFGLIGAFYRNLDTRLAGASLTSLTLHGSLLFTALVGLGDPRYTYGLWPVMMASLILAAAWAHSLATRHSQRLS
jgi:hypothetical protein